ncbi:metallophosphoesterase family protein [Rossellomorea marisflavi]|uniref:metallophosphoesterase family protein n=1 Tax=Rossellomorea marisflavi TaxID=189381 RepID=UPI00295EDD28|nr:metallophosphoesterase [Rossellomorea marisflavi]
MMKVVIVADTHFPKKGRDLPSPLLGDLKTADHIIHAGDFQTIEHYEAFKEYGQVTAVAGNVDDKSLKEILPEKTIITLKDLRIGVVHGDGTGKTTEKRARHAFEQEEVDLIIFGHSHIPYVRVDAGVLLFNPGSPTDKRKLSHHSHGVLEIDDVWSIKHIFYK